MITVLVAVATFAAGVLVGHSLGLIDAALAAAKADLAQAKADAAAVKKAI